MSFTHIVIPDTQVRDGVPTRHLTWIGRFIVDEFWGQTNVRIVHLGDHWDFPSLSTYDRGKMDMELRRYRRDLTAGNDGFSLLNEPLHRENRKRRKCWRPDRRFFKGNHDIRPDRLVQENAQLEGVISSDDINAADCGWTVHPFLEPVNLDGVVYAHFFSNPMSGRPYGGNVLGMLQKVGHSFTAGHQQGMQYAQRPVGLTRHHGLVAGSCYLHEERYMGPQHTAYWRGIVVCRQVENGDYDPQFISLSQLCRRYERKTLKEWMRG